MIKSPDGVVQSNYQDVGNDVVKRECYNLCVNQEEILNFIELEFRLIKFRENVKQK